jgi:predicted AAA+ superfamily ATPase
MKNYTIKRHIQQKIEKLIKQYKCLILTGPRQIGKSTLLLEGVLPNLKKKFNYVKLDNDDIISFAKNDPIKFLEEYKTPLYIDEVQKAPRLFSYIKTVIDDSDEKGQFILTGSESFELMKGVGDHLSTRAVVLSMQSLSNSEIQNKSNFEFVANFQKFIARKTKAITSEEIYKKIIRGSLPDLIKNKNLETDTFYQTYITSFILKDMKED